MIILPAALALWLCGSLPEDAADLLEGVQEIAAPGVPGEVSAFGPDAFVVVTAADGVPVAAAASAGKGRVLVLGHSGYLSPDALAVGQSQRFFENALQWLNQGRKRPRVASPGNEAFAEALRGLGFRASATNDLEVDCVLLGGDTLKRARIAELRTFVERGGGLLVAATGWGWQQLHPKEKLARDLTVNWLVVPYGLAFGTLQTRRTTTDGFAAGPRLPLAHAGSAFAVLEANRIPAGSEELVLARLRSALSCLPDHEPMLMRPLRAWLERAEDAVPLAKRLLDHARTLALRPLALSFGEWHVVGPFRGDRLDAYLAVEKVLGDMEKGREPDLTETYKAGRGKVGWGVAEVPGDGRNLDVGELLMQEILPADAASALGRSTVYLYRRIETTQPQTVAALLRYREPIRIHLDGRVVFERAEAKDEHEDPTLTLDLPAGVHHLLCKLVHDEGRFSFRLRESDDSHSIAAINAAIDRGVDRLLQHQHADGSWGGHDGYDPGYSAYAVYALLKCGLPPEHPAVERGLAYVLAREARYGYTMACKILALCAAGARYRGEVEVGVQRLLQWQFDNGLFGYPVYPDGGSRPSDVSITVFVALALRAAAGLGVEVPAFVYEQMIDGIQLCVKDSDATTGTRRAGIAYRVSGYHPSGAMTAGGLSVLLMAQEALGKRLTGRRLGELRATLRATQAWIETQLTLTSNPGESRWHYFFLYGIERLGALLETRTLGGLSWYRAGSEYLVAEQNDKGGWQGHDSDRDEGVDTILALLFLRRVSDSGTGKDSIGRQEVRECSGPISLRCMGSGPFDVWVTEYSEEVRQGLTRGVAGTLQYWWKNGAGEEQLAAEVHHPADAAWERERFATRIQFERSGTYELHARLRVDGAAPEAPPTVSPPLSLEVESFTPDVLEYARDHERNLLKQARSFEASSQLGGHPANHAADGSQRSSWRCLATDAQPWWRARFAQPVTCNRLRLSHAQNRRMDAGEAQAERAVVTLNGTEKFEVELRSDPLRKTDVEFGGPRSVTEVEVKIVAARQRANAAIGFAEIDLQLAESP